MEGRIIRLGIGAGLLYYGVLRGYRGLIIKLHSYVFKSVDLSSGTVRLKLNISVKNPLLVGITIKGIAGDVYAQGQKIGTINTAYDYYLGGGKTHIIPIGVDLQMSGLGSAAVLNIQSGDVRTLTVAFNGKLYVGRYNVGVPLRFELDYNDLTK